MAKVSRVRRLRYRSRNGKTERVMIPSCTHKMFKDVKKPIRLSEKKDWEDANCSVCMEAPHNAVLLLCSSYNKGCRPYMCATSSRFSNCLDQYKKAYTKSTSGENTPGEICGLLCPLCRGQVKGWTLVEPARKHLNQKVRTCMQEKCSFVGNYKELKKHVKSDHPCARPREVDPTLEEKWRSLENERERNDVISTLPRGTIVIGDYVIDSNSNPFFNFDMDDLGDELELFDANRMRSGGIQFHRTFGRDFPSYDDEDDDDDDDNEEDDGGPRHRNNGRMLFINRSRRRWRRN